MAGRGARAIQPCRLDFSSKFKELRLKALLHAGAACSEAHLQRGCARKVRTSGNGELWASICRGRKAETDRLWLRSHVISGPWSGRHPRMALRTIPDLPSTDYRAVRQATAPALTHAGSRYLFRPSHSALRSRPEPGYMRSGCVCRFMRMLAAEPDGQPVPDIDRPDHQGQRHTLMLVEPG